MSNIILGFNEVADLIEHVGPTRTVIVEGENGVGKTALHRALSQRDSFEGFIKPAPLDATQMSDGSVWMPDIDKEMGVSRELPNERYGMSRRNQRGINGSKPVLICIDEVLKVQQFIKNMLAPIMYERRIGDYGMVEGSVVFCCTNLSCEGLGDSLQPHLRSRVIVVRMRKPTMEEWVNNFAIPRKLNSAVVAFASENPALFRSFLDFEPGGTYAGKPQEKDEYGNMIFNPRVAQDGFVSPRTLHAASDVAAVADKLTPMALQAALNGTVGRAAGEKLASYLRFLSDITPYERVIADPHKAPVTANPTAQLVQVFQFITRAETREEAAAVVVYVKRIRAELQTLFAQSVAQSTRMVTFVNAPGFADLLAENKVFMGGVR